MEKQKTTNMAIKKNNRNRIYRYIRKVEVTFKSGYFI